MKNLLQLRAQKAELVEQSKAILAKAEQENRSINKAENTQFTELRSQIEAVNNHIEAAELLAQEERSLIGAAKEERSEKVNNEEFRTFVQTGDMRSMSAGVNADGGFTVVPTLDSTIAKQLRENSVFRQNATVKTCDSKSFKKLVSTGGISSSWGAESDTRGETDTSKLEEIELPMYSLYAYPKTTQELLDWSEFNIEAWLSEDISEEFMLKEESAFWNGDAVKKPKGILTYTRSTNKDGVRAFGEIQELESAETHISFGDLVTLQHSLKTKYRKNAKFYMSDNTALELRKLVDGDGNFMWVNSVVEGQPDTLLGKPVEIANDIEDDLVVFSDLARAYYVIDGAAGTRLIKDNITAPGFVKMHASQYRAGGLIDDQAVKILKKKAV